MKEPTISYTLDEPKIVANQGNVLGRFYLSAVLGKFWAGAPGRIAICLISNGKIDANRCLDIAGVASSILATPP
jgi:hypothetical protein